MKLCTETITVYNAKFDATADRDIYTATVIVGVSWCYTASASVENGGLRQADRATVRIPTTANFSGKSYVTPKQYGDSSSTPSSVFTFQAGDIVLKGSTVLTDPNPKVLLHDYGEAITVTGISDNRRGTHGKHWKLTGA